MKLHYLSEPLLEFGRGQDICPRAGITKYDVYDSRMDARRDQVFVGAVGNTDGLNKLGAWLELCAHPIETPPSERHFEMNPSFCGVERLQGFKATFTYVERNTRRLGNTEVKAIKKAKAFNERVKQAVDLYYENIAFLAEHRNVDVIVCVIPSEIYLDIAREKPEPVEESIEEEPDDLLEYNFRRLLKAKAMHLNVPIQIVREVTLEANAKGQQQSSTKAWNLCTALYYKANKTVPWKLITNPNRPSVCYAGIGFYRSRDGKTLNTSLAQIFDELGNGVIVRGTPVQIEDKDNRRPYLTEGQAYSLLIKALKQYEVALSTPPGRLVLHKSSNYRPSELEGFRAAADEMRVGSVDFATIMDTPLRLVRSGEYPPYRGTHIELDNSTHILYTRGSVKYFRTYPGKYIPQPIEVRVVESDESPSVICSEVLALTKMNWNNTQFDRKYPVTIECARNVGKILKYLTEEDAEPKASYSFYM